ncbi:hypothetical protein VDG1235_3638 [Verrucomicrobiia bacterium DG1235]|nr:hypothetical protein VDG1235_3638 [Verrucomicrobiae bacterium DG1235]
MFDKNRYTSNIKIARIDGLGLTLYNNPNAKTRNAETELISALNIFLNDSVD